jgi:hypothetical protein
MKSEGGRVKREKSEKERIKTEKRKTEGKFSATIHISYESHLVPVAYGIHRK